ncbi:hypothetical protein F0562_024331 [Nyssa sinensis]|uniref:Cytokinin glycosidase domain-containing protein n=1 Tax=Nyssa sinensis TaxID=561372 RepID=A0A5J5BEJ8_9ASTE|nr:hypothetical protein F0562_024331 [Nyssa sinensis]
MAHRGFPHPAFTPVDLTGVHSTDELQMQIGLAFDAYAEHLETVRRRQKTWAMRVKNFLKDPADATHLALANRRIASDEHWVRYTLPTDPQDTLLPTAQPLFTYSGEERIMAQVQHGLRVSGGADRVYQHQRGHFPKGPYGTTIAPFSQTVSLNAMRREFFDIEFSLPNVPRSFEQQRQALPMNHFIAFIPSTGFSPKGQLVFRRLDSGFEERFDHFALSTPHLNVGDYLKYDIVAYGPTLIPEEIPGTEVARNNTGEDRVLLKVELMVGDVGGGAGQQNVNFRSLKRALPPARLFSRRHVADLSQEFEQQSCLQSSYQQSCPPE